ncbi:MAG: ORF6N domain-containing protein [Bacilli bacterium]|nr:MAG: ORF6N domain-containing protein [Bacilli bacterium]
MRSKNSTSKINGHGGRRYNQRVFTEQGVYMLATILKSKLATSITIAIMDAFVAMKSIINTSLIEQKYFNELTIKKYRRYKIITRIF